MERRRRFNTYQQSAPLQHGQFNSAVSPHRTVVLNNQLIQQVPIGQQIQQQTQVDNLQQYSIIQPPPPNNTWVMQYHAIESTELPKKNQITIDYSQHTACNVLRIEYDRAGHIDIQLTGYQQVSVEVYLSQSNSIHIRSDAMQVTVFTSSNIKQYIRFNTLGHNDYDDNNSDTVVIRRAQNQPDTPIDVHDVYIQSISRVVKIQNDMNMLNVTIVAPALLVLHIYSYGRVKLIGTDQLDHQFLLCSDQLIEVRTNNYTLAKDLNKAFETINQQYNQQHAHYGNIMIYLTKDGVVDNDLMKYDHADPNGRNFRIITNWDRIMYPNMSNKYMPSISTLLQPNDKNFIIVPIDYDLFKNEIRIYHGKLQNGLRHGIGLISEDGVNVLYSGSFENNKKSGYGTEYDNTGKVINKGMFKDDGYIGQSTL